MRSFAFASVALLFVLALVPGCYDVNVGAHDAGGAIECSADADCDLGNQCVCGQCLSLDVMAPACDPDCAVARHGDLCTVEGRVCPGGPCSRLECRSGSMQRVEEDCDGGTMCECPAPPPGCYYDGFPCACDHLVCPGERCGRVTCGEGTVCCNDSCGMCAPPDVACAAIACAPDCSPQDAQGNGSCGRRLGLWAWNGSSCQELHGCESCVGADCPHTFATAMECEATFSMCARPCGGFAGASCSDAEYCDFPDPHLCGGADEQGVCRPRPTDCPPEIRTVCGCDGNTYASPCDATTSGTDVAREGACEAPCTPDDARGVGSCDALLGYAWTGTRCAGLSGCTCEGTACDVVRRSEDVCLEAHAHCIVPHT